MNKPTRSINQHWLERGGNEAVQTSIHLFYCSTASSFRSKRPEFEPDRPRLLIRGALVRVQHGLPNLISQRYQPEAQKYQVLEDQSGHAWPAGLFISSTIVQLYNILTDNANEPPLTVQTASLSEAPITLPEYVVEVMP